MSRLTSPVAKYLPSPENARHVIVFLVKRIEIILSINLNNTCSYMQQFCTKTLKPNIYALKSPCACILHGYKAYLFITLTMTDALTLKYWEQNSAYFFLGWTKPPHNCKMPRHKRVYTTRWEISTFCLA